MNSNPVSNTPDACCNRQEVIACVRAAVARLPLGQRQVLTLVDLEEFGYAEVAGNSGYSGGHGDESVVARARKPENFAGSCDAAACGAGPAEESEMNPVVSDETLNAFVDGELDVAESEALTRPHPRRQGSGPARLHAARPAEHGAAGVHRAAGCRQPATGVRRPVAS